MNGQILGKADPRSFALINAEGAVIYQFTCDSVDQEDGLVLVYDSDDQIKIILNLPVGCSVMEVSDI